MRKIDGVRVRGLTRKEVKTLKDYGFQLSFYNPPIHDPDKMDEGIEKVLELGVVDKEKFEDLEKESHKKTLKVFRAIITETYGSEDEEKNLSMSGDGSQTKNE